MTKEQYDFYIAIGESSMHHMMIMAIYEEHSTILDEIKKLQNKTKVFLSPRRQKDLLKQSGRIMKLAENLEKLRPPLPELDAAI